jgi:hypothetical protein
LNNDDYNDDYSGDSEGYDNRDCVGDENNGGGGDDNGDRFSDLDRNIDGKVDDEGDG